MKYFYKHHVLSLRNDMLPKKACKIEILVNEGQICTNLKDIYQNKRKIIGTLVLYL